ncbi:MAG: FAD-binding protein [Polyangiaceae bacterium]|nr:FAD-binding protein [Polyangiaceae bacterium]
MLLARTALPEAPAPARERALRLLDRRLGGSKVLSGREACDAYARDESEAIGRVPDAVVRAASADDLAVALAVARETGVPITPRGGGTGRTGGAVPLAGGIVLDTSSLGRIKEIDLREQLAVVEPGVVLAELQARVEEVGLFYPPDPSSLESCCLGGNVAENAGGPRAFKYGVTRDWVLGVEAFLVGGQRIHAGRRTRKGVTGYDVTGLLVGSEGTLAVLGDVTLRLAPKPPAVVTLLALFADVRRAACAVQEITGAGLIPRCLELLDDETLRAVRRAGNPIDERAGAMLLIELDGDPAACEADAERTGEACVAAAALDVLVAKDSAQRERLWAARRRMSPAVRSLTRFKLSEDVVVPRQRLVELLERNARTCERERVRTLTYGHAGDGNLHVNFLWDDDDELPRVSAAIEQLFRDTVALGGTLSGEHGIGVLKAPYLPIEQSPELIALQRDLKRVFDPEGLLNPGKIFPALGHGAC